jgi:hypothetical protein
MKSSQTKRRYERPTLVKKGRLEKIVAVSGQPTDAST